MRISLKTQNVIPLSAIVLVCISLAWILTFGLVSLPDVEQAIKAIGGSTVIGIVSVWLAFLIPAEFKHSLVFFRIKNALPGHRFISLCQRDVRIDPQEFDRRVLKGRNDLIPVEQNRLWYAEVYRKVQNELEVASVHRSFLLYRDAAVVVLLIAFLLVSDWLFFQRVASSGYLSVLTAVESLLLCLAANNIGKRFVTTSVAMFLSLKLPPEGS